MNSEIAHLLGNMLSMQVNHLLFALRKFKAYAYIFSVVLQVFELASKVRRRKRFFACSTGLKSREGSLCKKELAIFKLQHV